MNSKKKVLIIALLAVMVLSLGGVGFYYWYENTYYVSTEDAKVTGDLVRVSPQVSAKLVDFSVEEGQLLQKGQILGRQEMLNLPDSNLEMTILRAPISGIVLKKQGTIGEVASPGQALAIMVDPDKLYVNANIEETKLEKLKTGEPVEITIDQYPDKKFKGTIETVGQATAATFSLLPASSGGNFTKVVQKVPVKIQLEKSDVKLLPGTNAVVKIHVK